MGRPIAYEYVGYTFKNQLYPVYRDDTDPNLHYVVPPSMRIARDGSNKPKVNCSICETIRIPSAKGLGMLVPYLPDGLEAALKKEYGGRIAPLPMSQAGQVIILGADWWLEGIAAEEAWKVDNESYTGMDPVVVTRFKQAKLLWDTRRVRTPLRQIIGADEGYFLQAPTLVGSNIGAELPFNFGIFGADNVTEFKGLLKGGGIINGQVLYHYIGTTRPWAIRVFADLSKVHSYLSQAFSVGKWYARADIYNAVETLKERHIIEFTVWDENDQITTKYKPEKIFDDLMKRILDKAFDFHADMKPETTQAEAKAERWWWWNGAYQRKQSTVDISEIINIKITIHGASAPIPISIGLMVEVPKDKIQNCTDLNLVDSCRDDLIDAIYNMSDEQVIETRKQLQHVVDAKLADAS